MPEKSKIFKELKETLATLKEPENLKRQDVSQDIEMIVESYNQICY